LKDKAAHNMTKPDVHGDVLGRGVNRQTTLKELMTKVLLGVAAVLVLLAVVFYWSLAALERKQNDEHARQLAATLNTAVETLLLRYIDKVDMLAADPDLLELVQYPERREARANELAKMIGAQQVMLFAKGEERGLAGDFPLLSFSELNLVFEADEGRQARVEYHRLPNGDFHFDVVRPLKKDGEVYGFALARFDGAMFMHKIDTLNLGGGRFELRQVLSDGGSEQFVGRGNEALVHEDTAVELEVANTNWRQSYWGAEHGWYLFGLAWWIVYILSLLIILIILGLAMWLFVVRAELLVDKFATLFYSYVQDRLTGRWLGKRYVSPLWEVEYVMQDLKGLNWTEAATRSQQDARIEVDEIETFHQSAALESERGRKEFEQKYVDILNQDKEAIEPEGKGKEKDNSNGKKEESVEAAPDLAYEPAFSVTQTTDVPESIFKAYDIRGLVGETLTTEIAFQIGKAFGTEAWTQGEQAIVVGRDARPSSDELAQALIEGLRESGRDVIDIGQVPTPLVYFATHYLSARSGVMVTGSHNPAQYNGFKLVLRNAVLSKKAIRKIRQRILSGDYSSGEGSYSSQDLVFDYTARLTAEVDSLDGLSVVLDCGNSVAAKIAPDLLRSLGCRVVELFCEVDGTFPNHHPDPSQPENMQALSEVVREQKADLGLAFDGDGDRIGVVDAEGAIVWPDRLMMLFARDVLQHHPGAKVVYDVKSSRHLRRVIEENGGKPVMWKSGHSLMRAKMKEEDALLAGEFTGHIFFQDHWYGFDDALYSAVRLLQIIARSSRGSAAVFAALPEMLSTPELHVPLAEGRSVELMRQIEAVAGTVLTDAQLSTLDGVRAEFADGWGLVRASNTMPCLTLRFEAEDEEALERLKTVFRELLLQVDPALQLPF
jgi:phosphomannomutase/phosphoglucomutase